jgi:SAM-dependent methyltransferase
MVDDAMTDRTVLRERQYADAGNLSARQSLWAQRPGKPRTAIWLDALALEGTESVLDVGCGNGTYLAELRQRGHAGRLVGVDLSPGMAREAATSGAAVLVADAAHLPLAGGVVDVALAMHMLYHVPDLPATIAEIRRVVRPGGRLLAATNGAQHTVELNAVIDAAVLEVTGEPWDRPLFSFTLETGAALLSASFERVERSDFREVVVVPSVETVVAYIESFQPEYCRVRPGEQWEAFLATARDLVTAQVREHGGFPVTAHSGIFDCR